MVELFTSAVTTQQTNARVELRWATGTSTKQTTHHKATVTSTYVRYFTDIYIETTFVAYRG